jgi:hypothetical protein
LVELFKVELNFYPGEGDLSGDSSSSILVILNRLLALLGLSLSLIYFLSSILDFEVQNFLPSGLRFQISLNHAKYLV